MTDFDLDRLGDLWRAQPDPAEMERLQRSADAAARRARWGHLSDLALAALVSLAVILLVWSNPTVKTGLLGGAAILLMLSSTIRQRQLRKAELGELAGSSEQMLDQSIQRVEATLKRIRFGLVGVGPGFLVGIVIAASSNSGAGNALIARLRDSGPIAALAATAIVAGLIALSLYFLNMVRRNRAELARLTTLREAYRRETEDSEE